MLKRLVITAALPWLTGMVGLPASAAGAQKPLYQSMIERYPAPALKDLTGREFKSLVDPTQLPKEPKEALAELWERFKAVSEKAGFSTISRKAGKPLKVETAVKEYLDTPGQDLWKHGYILRMTAKTKKGDGNLTITMKAIHEDALRTLAAALTVVGADAKTESEGNVGIGPGGQLTEYVEKGSSWKVRIMSPELIRRTNASATCTTTSALRARCRSLPSLEARPPSLSAPTRFGPSSPPPGRQ